VGEDLEQMAQAQPLIFRAFLSLNEASQTRNQASATPIMDNADDLIGHRWSYFETIRQQPRMT